MKTLTKLMSAAAVAAGSLASLPWLTQKCHITSDSYPSTTIEGFSRPTPRQARVLTTSKTAFTSELDSRRG